MSDYLRTQLWELTEAAEEALEFIENYEDVVDGDYGQPAPNKAMQICVKLRQALGKA